MNGWTNNPGVPPNKGPYWIQSTERPDSTPDIYWWDGKEYWSEVENGWSGVSWRPDEAWASAHACLGPCIKPDECAALKARVAELEDLLSDAGDELSSRIDDAFPERHHSPREMQYYTAAMEITRKIWTALEGSQDA
jgi:hypothetical protein